MISGSGKYKPQKPLFRRWRGCYQLVEARPISACVFVADFFTRKSTVLVAQDGDVSVSGSRMREEMGRSKAAGWCVRRRYCENEGSRRPE